MRVGLDQNHTIMGLHSTGNECTTDALGFLNQYDFDGLKEIEDVGIHHIFTRIEPNLNQGIIKNLRRIRMQACSHCWICEGWTEF